MSGCQQCDTCESGNHCSGTCNTCQSFCENGYQSVGGFSFNECVSQGERILHKTNWNRLITYIQDAYDEGRECDASEYGISSNLPSSDPNDYITADMFNKVAKALKTLTSSYSLLSVDVGDVIYGTYFETLEDYANRLKYKWDQCDRCNISCDVTCNSCNGCNGSSQASYCCSAACENACQSDSPSP